MLLHNNVEIMGLAFKLINRIKINFQIDRRDMLDWVLMLTSLQLITIIIPCACKVHYVSRLFIHK